MVESVNNNSVSTVSVAEKNQKVKRTYVAGNFEGPLDLLLFLIKESEINIYDIRDYSTDSHKKVVGVVTRKDINKFA